MKKSTLGVLLFIVAGLYPANGQAGSQTAGNNSIRYTVMLAGNRAGYETDTKNSDGSLQLYYEFNDRGRGPKVIEHVVLGADGMPTAIENSGHDYLKSPVAEQFSLKDGLASWKNRAEEGHQRVSGKPFYVSISGAFGEGAILAQALLKAGGRLALLPAGEASIQKRASYRLKSTGRSARWCNMR